MSEIDLDAVKSAAAACSMWAHIATVGSDGAPDVVPVHPCWEGDTVWIMCGIDSVKARNIAHNAQVALHWQVDESGDGVEVWGTATLHDDLDTKRRLWSGVFDYDLNAFAPGGPDGSPEMGFLAVRPERAMVMTAYGMGGVTRWRTGD